MGLVRTHKSTKKAHVRQADDTFRRAGELAAELIGIIEQHRPKGICIESFSPPRHASVAGKMGHAYGVVAALSELHDLPVIAATPVEVRRAVEASHKDKEEVEAFLRTMYMQTSPKAIRRFENEWRRNKTQLNHAWDAVAVYEAVKRSEVIRALRF
jgi:Holliday junction resolvasome RuvABC endonuclease subunit